MKYPHENGRQGATEGKPRYQPDSLLLVTVAALGLAVRTVVVPNIVAVVVGATALIAAAVVHMRKPSRGEPRGRPWEAMMAGVVAIYGLIAFLAPTTSLSPTSSAASPLIGLFWAALAAITYLVRRRSPRRVAVAITALTLAATILFGTAAIAEVRGVGFDVLFLHTEAAQALANGQNPYTDAVAVPNGAPTAEEGDLIEGYVYPPVTLIAYASGFWALDDPRYVSLAAWTVVLGLFGLTSLSPSQGRNLYVMLLLAALPGIQLVLQAAWTEPLSLAFLVAAFFYWHRPKTSGLALGLALASKQYFIVSWPLLLLHRDGGWRRRTTIAVAVAGLTLAPALLWDVGAFWSAAIGFHAGTPPRLDSSNLVGLVGLFGVTWDPPFLLALGAPMLIAGLFGWRSRTRIGFALTLSVALTTSFLLSTQAFANYWFLILGLGALVLTDLSQSDEV